MERSAVLASGYLSNGTMYGHPSQGHHILLFQCNTPEAILLPGRCGKECGRRPNSVGDDGIAAAQYRSCCAADVVEKPVTNQFAKHNNTRDINVQLKYSDGMPGMTLFVFTLVVFVCSLLVFATITPRGSIVHRHFTSEWLSITNYLSFLFFAVILPRLPLVAHHINCVRRDPIIAVLFSLLEL
jgi:hypothetical protein